MLSWIFSLITADNAEQLAVEKLFKTVPDKPYQVKTKEYCLSGKYEVVDQGKNSICGYNNDERKVFMKTPVIIYGDHTTIIKYRTTPFIIGGDGVKLLMTITENNLLYLYYALEYFNINAEGYKRHYSIVKKIGLPVPTIEEQNKYSLILSKLDLLIHKQEKCLDALTVCKKGLLQQLFI